MQFRPPPRLLMLWAFFFLLILTAIRREDLLLLVVLCVYEITRITVLVTLSTIVLGLFDISILIGLSEVVERIDEWLKSLKKR